MNILKFAGNFNSLDSNTQENVRKIIFGAYRRAVELKDAGVSGPEVSKEFKSNERIYKASCDKALVTLLWDSASESLKREFNSIVAGKINRMPEIQSYIIHELGGDGVVCCENQLEQMSVLISDCKQFSNHCSNTENNIQNIVSRASGENTSDIDDLITEEELKELVGDDENTDEVEDVDTEEKDNNSDSIEDTSNNEEEDEDEDDFDDPELVGAVNRVMAVMCDLYEVGFELKPPAGVLTKEGMIYIKNGNSKQLSQASLAKIYKIINTNCGNILVQSEVETGKSREKLRDMTFRKGTTYYPEYVLGNALGITSKGKVNNWRELEASLKKEVKYVLKTEIEKGVDVECIVDAFTTGIIVNEYDPKSCIKLRIAVAGNRANADKFKMGYLAIQRELFGGSSRLGRCTAVNSGVVEVDIILDDVAYNGKPLFAYEAVRALLATGRTPSISNAILGQDSSGRIMTTNLTAQDHAITLIGAGQRSGKGVLTLNLLGAILASGSPLIYLDAKPDMSVVIREIGAKYGIAPACWDSNNSFGNTLGRNAPSEVKSKLSGLFGKLVYLKVVQLMMVTAHLSMEGNRFFSQTPFFIFDEALAFQQTIKANWNTMMGHTGKKEEGELADWCRHIADWGDTIQGDLAGTINSQLPASGVCTIWLFQSMQPTNWSSQSAKGLTGVFNPFKEVITSRMSTKLMGRGTYDSEYALMNVKNVSEIKNKIDNRWFAKSNSQKIAGPDDVRIFKPYLVLNYAENGKDCVEAFKKNVGADVWNNLAPNGSLDPAAGLEGYIDLLGKGAIKNLGLGMDLLNQLMEITGLSRVYSSVEDYLYDASAESFYPLQVLKNGEVGLDRENNIDADSIDLTPELSDDIIEEENNEEESEIHFDFGEDLGGAFKGDEKPGKYGGRSFEGDTGRPLGSDVNNDNTMGDTPVEPVKKPEPTYNGNGIPNIPEDELIDIGITPEQLARVLKYVDRGQPKSFVDNDGYNVTTESGDYVTPATPNNTIDCTRTSRVKIGWARQTLMSTITGTDVYMTKLFDNVLKEVAVNFRNKSSVTRFAVIGESMWANGLQLNLNGVIGGQENILVSDIFDIKVLFKRFKNIKELELDTNNLSNVMMELGSDNPYSIFGIGKNLRRIVIHDGKNTEVLQRYGRGSGELTRNARTKATLDAAGATYSRRSIGDNWRQNTKGKEVWGRNTMKRGLNYAGSALGGDKVKPIRGTLAAVGGVTLGVVGAVSWFGFNAIKTIKGLWNGSR